MGTTNLKVTTGSGVNLDVVFNWTQGAPKNEGEYYSVGMLALEEISILELMVRMKRAEKTHAWDESHLVSTCVGDVVGEIIVQAMAEHFGSDRFIDGLVVSVSVHE